MYFNKFIIYLSNIINLNLVYKTYKICFYALFIISSKLEMVMNMKRLVLDNLVKWKNNSSRKPLILKSAQQVGKHI